jgi:hypothetical protein
MSKDNGNGHGDPREIIATIPGPADSTITGVTPVDAKKEEAKKSGPTKLSSIQNAFHTPHSAQAVDYLVVAGKEVLDMAMRANFSSKNTPAHAKVRALARHLAKCEMFHNDRAKAEALLVCAGDVGVDAHGRDDLVRALTGQSNQQARLRGQNMINRFSDWVQGGRGKDKEVVEQQNNEG